jgi:hypothetical protein
MSLTPTPKRMLLRSLGRIFSYIFSRFLNRLKIGSIKILNQDFPLFLYNEEEIDPNDVSAGLFKSELLVAVSFRLMKRRAHG